MTRTVMLASIAPGLFISGAIQTAPLGSPYSATLTVIGGGGPYRFAESGSLPAGLSFADNGNGTCTISGTPTAVGNFPITITVTDGQRKTAARNFVLSAVALPLSISGHAVNGTQGSAYSYSYTLFGGLAPYNCVITAGTFPSGLSLSSTGVISGTPTMGAAYSWTVTATDSLGATTNLQDSCAIRNAAVTLTGAFTSIAVIGVAYSSDLTISGGNGSYSNPRFTSGSVPGMSLSIVSVGGVPKLRLSGTATTQGSYNITVAVDSHDYDGSTMTGSSSQTVTESPQLTISGTFTSPANVAFSYSSDLLLGGGDGTYSLAGGTGVSSGTLPAGLTLSIVTVGSNKYLRLSGTPTTDATYSFTVSVNSGDGQNATSAQSVVCIAYLDSYVNSGWVAVCGMRKLISTYSGAIIRVRRSSDNAEMDIGFVNSRSLDQAALMAFVGSGNGFVSKIYDQSGNGAHLIEDAASSGPKIVSSGSYNQRCEFNGTSSSLGIASIGTSASSTSMLMYMADTGSAATRVIVESSANYNNSNNTTFFGYDNSNSAYVANIHSSASNYLQNKFSPSSMSTLNPKTVIYDLNGSTALLKSQIWVNSSSITGTNITNVSTSGTFASGPIHLFSRNGASLHCPGYLCNLAIYNGNISSNRSSCEQVIGTL